MSIKTKVFLACLGLCIAFWIGVVALISTSTAKLSTDEQRICAYLADHTLPQTWRYTIDELGMSSDMGVAAIEDARTYTCPSLKSKG